MEQNKTASSMGKFALPIGVVVVIAIAAIALYNSQSDENTQTIPQVTQESQSPEDTHTAGTTEYADGIYAATGNYVSPGGPREIGVTITLANGVITDSTFEGRAQDATSQRFQGEFADNYKQLIVGKNIDEVSLTKVSGSSLTPIGFTEALEEIKAQAQS